jgi:hypothetical protein
METALAVAGSNVIPIAARILEISKHLAPLEAALEVAKTELRAAAETGTFAVEGVGKVTLAAAVEGSSKTELALDVAAFEGAEEDVRAWLLEHGLVVNKVTKTPARKSAVKVALNA